MHKTTLFAIKQTTLWTLLNAQYGCPLEVKKINILVWPTIEHSVEFGIKTSRKIKKPITN